MEKQVKERFAFLAAIFLVMFILLYLARPENGPIGPLFFAFFVSAVGTYFLFREEIEREQETEELSEAEVAEEKVKEEAPVQAQTQTVKEVYREKEILREIVKIRCRYCGRLYEERLDRCPHCGAS
jgi:predicted Zn-ribbon and HTH transcriptional regulator